MENLHRHSSNPIHHFNITDAVGQSTNRRINDFYAHEHTGVHSLALLSAPLCTISSSQWLT